MSARRYVQRHLDAVALLKTLGATRAFTLSVSILQLLVIAIAATIIGSAIGFLAQEWLLRAIRGLLNAELPPADFKPLAVGFITAVAVLAGFALPPAPAALAHANHSCAEARRGPPSAGRLARIRTGAARRGFPRLLDRSRL